MSTTVAEIGSVYCSVVSFANTRGTYEMDKGAIVQSLIAIRLKLKRSLVLRTNIVYEVRPCTRRAGFPLTGRLSSRSVENGRRRDIRKSWRSSCTYCTLCARPSHAHRPESLFFPFVHASQAAYLLSHLMSVVERLEPAWRRAFLRRTRLLDADFQGDVLAVISTWPSAQARPESL
jgi:hypothetical protein